MSRTSTDKTTDNTYLALFSEYRQLVGTGVRVRDVAKWIDENNKVDPPTVDRVSLLVRKLKQVIRRQRVRDLCGRQIQPVVAIKIEKMTAGGQKVFEFVYDYLHQMSLDHALSHFGQKDSNILKQRQATTRNLQSCLDFNPNVKGHEVLFEFEFVMDEPSAAVEEAIEESIVTPPKLPESNAAFPSESPSGIAKERRDRDQTYPR